MLEALLGTYWQQPEKVKSFGLGAVAALAGVAPHMRDVSHPAWLSHAQKVRDTAHPKGRRNDTAMQLGAQYE